MSNTYEYKVKFDADVRELDDAEDAVDDLVDAVKELERQDVELDVDESAARSALQALNDLANETEAEFEGMASAMKAVGAQIGPSFDSAKVETFVTDLREMGVSFDQIEAKAKEFADVMQRADQIDLNATNQGLTTARSKMDGLTDSAQKSRNATANMWGNAAQDLGAFTGVAGSAGVALGQLAEGAADAKNSGEGLGSVMKGVGASLGPIAALSIGVAAATKLWGDYQKRQKEVAENTAQAAEALLDITGIVEALNDELSGQAQVGDFGDKLLASLASTNEEFTTVLSSATQLGIEFTDLGDIIAGLGEKGDVRGLNILVESLIENLGLTRTQAEGVAEAMGNVSDPTQWAGLTTEIQQQTDLTVDQTLALKAQLELYGNIAGAAKDADINEIAQEYLTTLSATTDGLQQVYDARTRLADAGIIDPSAIQIAYELTAANEDVAASLDEINAAITGVREESAHMDNLWRVVLRDMTDGVLDYAVPAWNYLQKALNLDADAMAELVDVKLAEKMAEDTAAAEETTEALLRLRNELEMASDPRFFDLGEDALDGTIDQMGRLEALMSEYSIDAPAAFEAGAEAIEAHDAAIEESNKAMEEAEQRAMDVAEAHATLGEILAETTDFADDLAAGLDEVDKTLAGLAFDVNFESAFPEAIDALDSFGPDLQTLADNWESILAGDEVVIFGNVRADDAKFMELFDGITNLFQEGVVNEFEQGGIDAANEFARSSAQAFADARGMDVADVYKIWGLGPNGEVDAIIQPAVDLAAADKAARILEVLAGVSDDPRIAQIQIRMLTDPTYTPEQAAADAQALAQGYLDGTPVTIPSTVEVDPDAATGAIQGWADGLDAVAVPVGADTDPADDDVEDFVDETEDQEPLIDIKASVVGALITMAIINTIARSMAPTVTIGANPAPALAALAKLAATTTHVPVDAYMRDLPSASEMVSRITGGTGRILVPIDGYVRNVPRIDGKWPT